jgi:hypothetical protein
MPSPFESSPLLGVISAETSWSTEMRLSGRLIGVFVLATLVLPTASQDQGHSKLAPKILAAKTVYFDDKTGAPHVGENALEQIKKWGRFRVVRDRKQADLIFLLSADPYRGGHIATAGGETGTVDKNGKVDLDPVPNFNKLSPVRYAYLTVIDPATEENLWSDSHQWGGLLTGFNSVGERLVKKLEKQMRK